MFAWTKGLDLAGKLGVGLVAFVLIAALFVAVKTFVSGAFEASEEKGAATVRAEVAEKGMSNVENANKAAAQVHSDPVIRNADCLRDSRTPENC